MQLATFCEKVLQEANGVLSLIRVIDRITIVAHGEGAPVDIGHQQVQTTLVIALKSDDARGRHRLSIRVELPSGQQQAEQQIDMTFEGEERGVQFVAEVALEAIEGLHWVDVMLNGEILTRVPLRIMYQRVPGGLVS